jgi:hypothetical protein
MVVLQILYNRKEKKKENPESRVPVLFDQDIVRRKTELFSKEKKNCRHVPEDRTFCNHDYNELGTPKYGKELEDRRRAGL